MTILLKLFSTFFHQPISTPQLHNFIGCELQSTCFNLQSFILDVVLVNVPMYNSLYPVSSFCERDDWLF